MFALLKQSDARAVRQVLRGRRDQFDTLVKRYLPAVYAVSYAQLRNHADAEDVAQEAFLTAFTSLHTLREPHKFEGWVVSMARRIAVHLRQKRQSENEANGVDSREAVVIPDAARDELRQLLRQEIDRLDGDDREVLLLHYFTGKSAGEMAVALGIGREAAKKRLQRARQQLSDNMLRRVEDETKPRKSFKSQRSTIAGLVLAAAVPWEGAAAITRFSLASAGSTKITAVVALGFLLVGTAYLTLSSPSMNSGGDAVETAVASPILVAPALLETPPNATQIADDTLEPTAGLDDSVLEFPVSLAGLWKTCDSYGFTRNAQAGGDYTRIEQSGSEISIRVPQGSEPGTLLATGTLEGDQLQFKLEGVESLPVMNGILESNDSFTISGAFPVEGERYHVDLIFARLSERDLAEVEIWERRREEVEILAKALKAFRETNNDMPPATLAALNEGYLKEPQVAESSPSRTITYAPNGAGSLEAVSPYPDATSHRVRLLQQEADRLAAWPAYPSMPPIITIQYAAPPMTLVERPQGNVIRIDKNSRLACPEVRRETPLKGLGQIASCENNMSQLGIVLKMFMNDDREKRYPGGFAVTVPQFLIDTLILTCPGLEEGDLDGRTLSYEFLFPGFTNEELRAVADELDLSSENNNLAGADDGAARLGDIPLVLEAHECSGSGGSHVLFADSHIEVLQSVDWEARVAPFVEYAENYYAGL